MKNQNFAEKKLADAIIKDETVTVHVNFLLEPMNNYCTGHGLQSYEELLKNDAGVTFTYHSINNRASMFALKGKATGIRAILDRLSPIKGANVSLSNLIASHE